MTDERTQPKVNTKHLEMPAPSLPPNIVVPTGPLDKSLPWVIEFRAVGTTITLQAQVKDNMILGRSDPASGFIPEVDLTSCDAFAKGVSRKHAMIFMQEGKLMLKDLHSTNGTHLNEMVCSPQNDYRLRHGDEISLGRLRLQVFFAVVPAHTQPAPPVPVEKPTSGVGKHVLVIEDDRDVGNVFKLALEMQDYDVKLVYDATQALSSGTLSLFDVIVMDLMLPDMDGFDLVRYFRRTADTTNTPVIVVSGATAGYQMGKALEAGANIFLGKPVAVEELIRAVGVMVSHDRATINTNK
jgi:CheY-like chemotaxis protein